MAIFSTYVEVETEVEIDLSVKEIYGKLDSFDKKELKKLLNEEDVVNSKFSNALDDEWSKICLKLKDLRRNLSIDEEESILNLVKKYS
jgi:hypothetical protein